MKTIVVGNTHGLAHGKTAIATTLTRADAYRIGTNGWQSAADLAHETPVDAVRHFGRHETERGEVVQVESLDGPTVRVQILDIRVREVERLTADDFQALGYKDRADYQEDFGEVFGGRLWWMRIKRLPRLFGKRGQQ